MNRAIVISLSILILIGIGVSRIKYEVVFLRKNLQEINKELDKCLDDIKVYTAEWSYLNTPQRLKALSTKYLKNMKPLENNQIINYERFTKGNFRENFNKAFEEFLNDVAKTELR
jgi:hypothetical protein